MSLLLPIPPATVSFHARAIVHAAASPDVQSVLEQLGSLVPAERRATCTVIEVVPEGCFLTYDAGVSLMDMRSPAKARARVPVA